MMILLIRILCTPNPGPRLQTNEGNCLTNPSSRTIDIEARLAEPPAPSLRMIDDYSAPNAPLIEGSSNEVDAQINYTEASSVLKDEPPTYGDLDIPFLATTITSRAAQAPNKLLRDLFKTKSHSPKTTKAGSFYQLYYIVKKSKGLLGKWAL